MTISGTFVNGVIVLEHGMQLPEGARVRVELTEPDAVEPPQEPYDRGKEVALLRESLEDVKAGRAEPFEEFMTRLAKEFDLPAQLPERSVRYTIEIAPRAMADIQTAVAWLVSRGFSTAAARWHRGILATIRSLADHPGRCPLAEESADLAVELREIPFGRRRQMYRILFIIEGSVVYTRRGQKWRQEGDALPPPHEPLPQFRDWRRLVFEPRSRGFPRSGRRPGVDAGCPGRPPVKGAPFTGLLGEGASARRDTAAMAQAQPREAP
jgi:plasmid stabilization system protein ParE